MKRFVDGLCWTLMLVSGLLLALSLAIPKALAQDDGWPRTLQVDDGLVTIYPLQVDGMEQDVIRYRAALAWRETPGAEPVFGAGWFESRVAVDRNENLVHPLDLRVTNTRFPAGTDELQPALAAALNDAVSGGTPGWNLDFPLDRLDAALASARAEEESLQQLNTTPPRIVYRDRPALLVTFDGEPVLRAIEDSPYQAVINTPYPLITDGKRFYLNVAKGAWYRADAALGPYRFEPAPPAAITALVKPEDAAPANADAATAAAGTAPEPITAANAPEIVVATEPTELLVTEGPAAFVPLVDDLLVLNNSDDDVFMDVSTQRYYIVLAGRWYHADSLNGPWEYQAADALPPAFASIPQNSDQADSRVYVAGTPEAEEAVLDAQVPQTAAVERGQADVDVAYDGEPEFAPVEGTDLEYARNTGSTVLQSNRTYYLVEDGVWYVSHSPNGPWQVSDYRPESVDAIAPTSPVYNVKYVYIYDSTPDVVYVGYTPGYLGSYVYYDTVVYGTGWYYRPWISPRYYYPRFSTWGFHVGYTPWYGWSFGLSWNWGWGSAWIGDYPWGWGPYYANYYSGGYWHHHHDWHHRYYGYWGPRGYCPRPYYDSYRGRNDRYAYGDRYYGDRNYGDRYGGGRDYGDGYRDRGGYGSDYGKDYPGRHPNLYRDAGQRARIANTWDKLPRERGLNGAKAAQVKNVAKQGYSSRPYGKTANMKPAASARYGNEPVKAADLLMKAGARDANAEASRKLMLADSQGKVYRKQAARSPVQAVDRAVNRAVNKPVSKAVNRIAPAKTVQRAEQSKGSAAQNRAQAKPQTKPQTKTITAGELAKKWSQPRPNTAGSRKAEPRANVARAEKVDPAVGAARQKGQPAARTVERKAAPQARAEQPSTQKSTPVQKSAPARAERAPAQKSAPGRAERAPVQKSPPARAERAPVQNSAPARADRASGQKSSPDVARRELAPQMRAEPSPRNVPEPSRREYQAPQARNPAPPPTRNSAPPQARSSAPPQARQSAPPQTRQSAPPQARTSAPAPSRNSAPPPSRKAQPASQPGGRDRGEKGGHRRD